MEKNYFNEVDGLFARALRGMTLAQLRVVNKLTVNRIKEAHSARAKKVLANFKEGDWVEFVDGKERTLVRGVVSRLVEPQSLLILVKPFGSRKQLRRVSANICRLTTRDYQGATPDTEVPSGA
jgi:hypothetical protein